MREVLLNLSKMDDFPNGLDWIIKSLKNIEYPTLDAGWDEWARNFLPYLPDFRKQLCNFEADNVTRILKKVFKEHCTNDMKAMYEMFG